MTLLHFFFGLSLAGCVPLLLISGGLLFVFLGGWGLQRECFLSKHGLVVPGEVIAIDTRRERGRKGGSTTVRRSVATFQPQDFPEPVTFISPVGSIFRFHRVGQSVQVMYLAEDLKSARINDFTRWFGPWLVIGLSVAFLVLTVLLSFSTITLH